MDSEGNTTASHLGNAILVKCQAWVSDAGPGGRAIIGDVAGELATAARQVTEARRRLAQQRRRLLKSRSRGLCTPDQELTLAVFASTLELLEGQARQLEEAAKYVGRPRPLLS